MKKQFVLYDKSAKIYAGLNGSKIVIVDSIENAIHFEHGKDNPLIKCKFYNAITGMNFRCLDLNPE